MSKTKTINGLTIEETIKQYEPMIHKLIQGATIGTVCNREDLVQEGYVAIIRAFNSFDPKKGASFTTWVHRYISGALLDYQKANLSALSGGAYLQQVLRKAGPDATPEQLKSFNLNKRTLNAASYIHNSFITTELSKAPEYEISEEAAYPMSIDFFDWRSYLNEAEISLIEMHFGFNERNEAMTFKDIGKIIGKNPHTVSSRIKKIIDKLKLIPGIEVYNPN